jgi:hypothetical protein
MPEFRAAESPLVVGRPEAAQATLPQRVVKSKPTLEQWHKFLSLLSKTF